MQRNNEASRKNLETQIGQLSKLMTAQSRGGFGDITSNNQKNDARNMSEVATPMRVVKSEKKRVEYEVEKEGEKIEKLIYLNSILRKAKSNILKDGDKPKVIPYYVTLPYSRVSKNKEIVKYPKNKNCKVIESRTRNIPKLVSLEHTKERLMK